MAVHGTPVNYEGKRPMTEAETRQIEALTTLVTEALDEPAPSPEAVAWFERFRKLTRRQRGRILVMLQLQDMAEFIKAEQRAEADELQENAALHIEVADARRWAKQAGQTARARR